ncbi:hypothetical protein B0H14DRAFT_3123798 [Mycena olivaceomarginata]|nr:hypothetical protein B0H14DRAFT_3123798 [Mycena olivaceomarginata]
MPKQEVLNVGDILAVLFSRSDIDTFHWTICVPINSTEAAKYHAKNSGDNWWFEDPVPRHSILDSKLVSASIKIGSLELNVVTKDILRDILQPISMVVPAVDHAREPKFTCRVWFREAVRVLHEARVLNCPDVDALEAECVSYAVVNQAALPGWKGYLYYVSKCSV